MCYQMVTLTERHVTYIALIWFLTRVSVDDSSICPFTERLAADITRVKFLLLMRPLMCSQAASKSKAFTINIT